MRRTKRGRSRKRKPGVGRQRGGIAPLLAAAIPSLVAAGKAVGLGALSTGASYGTKRAIQAIEKKRYKRARKVKRKHR